MIHWCEDACLKVPAGDGDEVPAFQPVLGGPGADLVRLIQLLYIFVILNAAVCYCQYFLIKAL